MTRYDDQRLTMMAMVTPVTLQIPFGKALTWSPAGGTAWAPSGPRRAPAVCQPGGQFQQTCRAEEQLVTAEHVIGTCLLRGQAGG